MRLPKLKGKLRKPTNLMQRKKLASRDYYRRQQLEKHHHIITGRHYWRANGYSYGQIVPAELGSDFEYSTEIFPQSETFTNVLGGSNIRVNIGGDFRIALYITGYATAFSSGTVNLGEVNTLSISRVSGLLSIKLNGVSADAFTTNDIIYADLIGIRNSGTGGTVSPFQGFILSTKITGITNTDAYPTGTAHWKMDTDASKDGYVFYSENNDAMQLYNAVPDDFCTELPTPPPSERYYWYNDGTGYGSITPIETSQATLFETQCVVLSYGVYQRFFGSEDYLLSCDTGVDNSTFRLVNCNAWLDDVPIVSEVTPLPDVNEQFNLKVQPLGDYTVSTLFGLAQDGKIINSIMWDTSITGIQNTDDYPAGEEAWLCDTDASKDGYIYYGSTSGTEAILANATADQFLTYLPSYVAEDLEPIEELDLDDEEALI